MESKDTESRRGTDVALAVRRGLCHRLHVPVQATSRTSTGGNQTSGMPGTSWFIMRLTASPEELK